ncbi:MAG: pyrroline-5-carboxylate reductase family protein, partial [Burkholderiaceae bacterium]
MQNSLKIGFIGGGNMATALLGGLANKLTAGSNIHVVDRNPDALQKLSQQFGVTTAQQIGVPIAQSDVIVLAVKPQQMKEVIAELRPHIASQLVLSIAAGIRAVDLSRWLN